MTDQQEFFISYLTVAVFFALTLLYLVQGFLAIQRAKLPLAVKRPDEKQTETNLFQATLYFDGGYRNLWVFFILAIFFPVFLASMADTLPFIDKLNNKTSHPESSSLADGKPSELPAKFIVPRVPVEYFICLAVIVVLITLEFSYVHYLRESAPAWISILLVALALDFATLLTLTVLVKQPDAWEKTMNELAEIFMLVTTLVAFFTSFIILVLARTAGAVSDGKTIDVPVRDGSSNAY